MRPMFVQVRRFVTDEEGSTAMEYGLLGTLIGIAAIAAFMIVGGGLLHLFGASANGQGAGGAIQSAADTL